MYMPLVRVNLGNQSRSLALNERKWRDDMEHTDVNKQFVSPATWLIAWH